MRSKLALIVISLLVAASSVAACSSGEPVPDEQAAEAPQYQSEEDGDYEEYDTAEMHGEMEQPDQPQQPPEAGQPGAEAPQPAPGDEAAPQPPAQPPGGQQQHQAGDPPEATGPVATVNGDEITADEFNDQIEMLLEQMPHAPPQQLAQMQNEIVDQLIQQRLVDDAIEDAGIEVSDEQLETRLDEVRREFEETAQAQLGDDVDFDDFIAQMGMTPEEMNEAIEETIAIEKLLEERGEDMPTDEDVRQFYDDNPEMFTEPEHVKANQVIIPPSGHQDDAWERAEEDARDAHRQLTEEDASFQEVADQFDGAMADEDTAIPRQLTPEQQQQMQGDIPDELITAAFEELEDGEISEPIRIPEGYIIIERIEHAEEGVVPFEEVEEQLEMQLRNQALEESLQDFLAELEREAEVERHPENIE